MPRDVSPYPVPVAVAAGAAEELGGPEGGAGEVPPRQCGRCRMMFDGEPTLDVLARDGWALCPPCEQILLPRRARHGNVVPIRPVQANDDA